MQENEVVKARATQTDSLETVWALKLAVGKVDVLLQESETGVGNLAAAITCVAKAVADAKVQTCHFDMKGEISDIASELSWQLENAEANLQEAFTALQFYDRMSQRIEHTREIMTAVVSVLEMDEKLHGDEWQRLHEKLSTVYTAEQTRALLDQAVFNKSPVQEPPTGYCQTDQLVDNHVELF